MDGKKRNDGRGRKKYREEKRKVREGRKDGTKEGKMDGKKRNDGGGRKE